jgi:glycine cleavage system H protein
MEKDYEIRSGLFYAKSHEWVSISDSIATVGITAYAVAQMDKEIVNVELCKVETQLTKGQSFGIVDSVKAAFDLYAPVSGKVTEINNAIPQDPAIVANFPYDDGWMIKISMSNPEETKELLKAGEYKKLIEMSEE